MSMSDLPQTPSPGAVLTANICKEFFSAERKFRLEVEFAAAAGFTILFGPSGSGKTTLLDCIAGLTAPDAGRIEMGDRVLFDSNAKCDVSTSQRNVGYVF